MGGWAVSQVGKQADGVASERLLWDPYFVGFNEGKPNKGKFTLMNDSLSTVTGSKWAWQGWKMSLRLEKMLWTVCVCVCL